MTERIYWLAWSQISGVGPVLMERLERHFSTLAAAWQAKPADLLQVSGLGQQTVTAIIAQRSQINPEQFLEEHQQKNPDFWTLADPDYPRLLREIPNPPPVLYYRGEVNLLENQGITPAIAMVGTRQSSEYGRKWTRRISILLAKHGFTIISGMAIGIDTEAHRSCVDVGGRTYAILGTGVDVVYPPSNKILYERIIHQGLVVSEYPQGTQPKRENFPRRNRIIAGLSRAVLVMEAPQKSGALITAYQANEFGRDIYALTGRLDDYQSLGCLQLINKGAQIILSEEELLQMLGAIPQLNLAPNTAIAPSVPPPAPNLDPKLAQVLQAVTTEGIHLDLIVNATGLPVGSVTGTLLELELLDLVVQLPGMRYRRC